MTDTTQNRNARISGFHKMSFEERIAQLEEQNWLSKEDAALLIDDTTGGLSRDEAEYRSENNLGTFALPWGLCLNLLVDGEEKVAPMVIEEPSVVAAASYASLLIRAGGGFTTEAEGDLMVAQVQFVDLPDQEDFVRKLAASEKQIFEQAKTLLPRLYKRGGGLRSIEVRDLAGDPPMTIVHLTVDVKDAMGANLVNTLAEELTPLLMELAGTEPVLRILSNYCDQRKVKASCAVPYTELAHNGDDGHGIARRIEWASMFAERDPYRAVTHNKGIMNGVDAVVVASGNDWRQVEAACHAWAACNGSYSALATWRADDEAKVLRGRIELPLALGTVGPQIEGHGRTGLFYRVTGIKHANQLARLAATVGLAQNLGALRALASEGIQEGHMRLHARSVALAADCPPRKMNKLIEAMVASGNIKIDAALTLLADESF